MARSCPSILGAASQITRHLRLCRVSFRHCAAKRRPRRACGAARGVARQREARGRVRLAMRDRRIDSGRLDARRHLAGRLPGQLIGAFAAGPAHAIEHERKPEDGFDEKEHTHAFRFDRATIDEARCICVKSAGRIARCALGRRLLLTPRSRGVGKRLKTINPGFRLPNALDGRFMAGRPPAGRAI